MQKPHLDFVHLKGCPIYEQLQIEEAYLRASDKNICLVNYGSNDAIVLGISSKPEEMIYLEKLQQNPVDIIKRFSGGGTVYVDKKTLFVTFICNQDIGPSRCYPEALLRWGERFYQPVFNHPSFKLRENDYVLGQKKIGGNALYIRKNRWLLHTSFLWDYDIEKINLLKQPLKVPQYRKDRNHEEFITPLHHHYPSIDTLIENLKVALHKNFEVDNTLTTTPDNLLDQDYRKTLKRISF